MYHSNIGETEWLALGSAVRKAVEIPEALSVCGLAQDPRIPRPALLTAFSTDPAEKEQCSKGPAGARHGSWKPGEAVEGAESSVAVTAGTGAGSRLSQTVVPRNKAARLGPNQGVSQPSSWRGLQEERLSELTLGRIRVLAIAGLRSPLRLWL